MNWTPDDVQKLRDLWGQGLSGSQIAKIFQVTRNSIIGKAHRLQLSARKTSSSSQAKANGAKATKHPMRIRPSGWQRTKAKHQTPKSKVTPMEPIPEPVSLNLSLMALEPGQCRYPHGDRSYVFCGHPIYAGSYCKFHHRLCFMPIDQARQRRTNIYLMHKAAA